MIKVGYMQENHFQIWKWERNSQKNYKWRKKKEKKYANKWNSGCHIQKLRIKNMKDGGKIIW